MQILGSHNSQYFAAALSDEIKLFRAPAVPSMAAQTCELVWQHKTDRVITGPMLAVSDDGKVFLGGKEGLSYVCEGERGAPRYFKVQSLFDVVMEDKQSIAKIRIDRLGKTACWESTVNETSETSLMGFLKKLTTKGVNHSLFRLNLDTGEQKRLATVTLAEKDSEGVFQWGVSPRFCHLGLAAPEKRGNSVQLVDLEYNSEPVDWDTPAGHIERIDVNDSGHAVIHVRSDVDQLMFIGLQGKYKIVEPPPGFRIAYLGRTLVLHYEMRERLDIYNLTKNELETQVDLASLRLPANRSFLVSEEGSVHALLWNGTQMEIRGIYLADGIVEPSPAPAPAAPVAFEAPAIPPDAHDSDEWATTVMSGPRVTPVAPAPPPPPKRSSIVPGRESGEQEALPRPSVIPEREASRAPETLPRPAATQQFMNPPSTPRLGPPTPPPVFEPVDAPVPPPAVEEQRWSMRTEPASRAPQHPVTTTPPVTEPSPVAARLLPPVTEPMPPVTEPSPVAARPLPPVTEPMPPIAQSRASEPPPAAARPLPPVTEPMPPITQSRASEPPPAAARPLPPVTEPVSRAHAPVSEPPQPRAIGTFPPPATEPMHLGARPQPPMTESNPHSQARPSSPGAWPLPPVTEPVARVTESAQPGPVGSFPPPLTEFEASKPPAPEPAPPVRGTPRSLEEIEEELARLGLRYAAGDLSREEFLAQKAQWEGLKAFARPAPEVAAPLPLRLDLNL